MRWRQWTKEPAKKEDLPYLIAFNIGRPGTNISWEMETEEVDPDSYNEPETYWLPYKELMETLPKEVEK